VEVLESVACALLVAPVPVATDEVVEELVAELDACELEEADPEADGEKLEEEVADDVLTAEDVLTADAVRKSWTVRGDFAAEATVPAITVMSPGSTPATRRPGLLPRACVVCVRFLPVRPW
jgi:hypothetical protein